MMKLMMKLKTAIQGLTNTEKIILTFVVAVLPPVVVLLQEQSNNPYLYGAAILGGILAAALNLLASQ